ncbi:2-phospho-L-lactate guanylyltransferase [Haloechinothrix salitolerans]
MSEWSIVLPVKSWASAKSRMLGLGFAERITLVQALAEDTLRTIAEMPEVGRCFVVAPPDVLADLERRVGKRRFREVEDHAGGVGPDPLNSAFRQGCRAALREGYHQVAMVVGDVPGLTAAGLRDFLRAVPERLSAMMRDSPGSGTTILASRLGDSLHPEFGPGSAERHAAAGAVDLTPRCDPSLSHDVDTMWDLWTARVVSGSLLDHWFRRWGAVPVASGEPRLRVPDQLRNAALDRNGQPLGHGFGG